MTSVSETFEEQIGPMADCFILVQGLFISCSYVVRDLCTIKIINPLDWNL
jgi:hypothetical protein